MDHGKSVFHHSQNLTIFIEQWSLRSTKEFVGTCIAIGCLAFFHEAMKVVLHVVTQKQKACHKSSIVILTMNHVKYRKSTFRLRKFCWHLLQTMIYTLQTMSGFLIMLAVMSYNVYILMSAIVGFAFGYLMLGWITAPFGGDIQF
ncbi:protein SLC31A2-like [Clytia hemisphaerica]|uniref:Copper transport protein n=1 Tax=Clytia hemisphaerica TaxID=252671 RepID=A0A7M5V408_9CNID|eukprot:TCONS_00015617-protein